MTRKRVISVVIAIVLLSGIAAGGYYYFKIYKKADVTQSQGQDVFFDATSGEMLSSIKVLGETNLLEEQKLKFNIEGNVAGVYVKEGQKVKSGDLLAELDKGQLKNELKEANIKLENAKINLQKTLDKFSTDDKTKAINDLEDKKRKLELASYDLSQLSSQDKQKLIDEQSKITKQEIDLEKMKNDIVINKKKIQDDLSDAKKDYEYKQKNLADDKWKIATSIVDEQKGLENKLNDYSKTLLDTYTQTETDLTSVEDNLKSLNDALRVDSEYKRQEGNIYFSAKNTGYKNQAETYYWQAKSALIDARKKLNSYNKNSLTPDMVIEIIKIKSPVYDKLALAGEYTAKGADNSLATDDFTESEINSIKSQALSIKNQSNTAKSGLDTTVLKIKNLDNPDTLKEKSRIEIEKYNKGLVDLDKDLEKLKVTYQNLSLSTPDKIKQIDVDYTNAQIAYKKALQDFEDFKYKLGVGKGDKESEIKNLKLDYESALKDFNRKYSSKDEPEEILVAKNEVKQAEIAVDQVNKKIENYELKAPFDGVIDNFSMKVGDKLTNTSSTDEKYLHLVNPGLMEIKIKLDQIDIVKVSKGMEANVGFDSYPDKIFTGTIASIDSKPIDENGVKKYQVKMVIDKGDLNIFSGMSANVDIVLDKIENAIMVPTMSVEMDATTGMSYVTLMKDGKKVKTSVEVGANSNGNTQILSGVTLGDKVLQINFDANSYKPEDFTQGGNAYGGY